MTLLRDASDDLFALVARAAEHAQITNAAFVEKEYWALEALRSLQAPLDVDVAPAVIFKGGTSLSRALKLTRRFSDDIDVMLHYTGQLGRRARDRSILKTLIARAASDLGGASELAESTEGVKRNARLAYPTRFAAGVHSPGVLIEMTLRDAESLLPGTERVSMQSYIGAYLDFVGENTYEDTKPFETIVLSPVRTLFEKLSLLHGRAVAWRDNGEHPTDVGRHYYDVHRLLQSPTVTGALSDLTEAQLEEISGAVESVTRGMRLNPQPRPVGGYAASAAFAPSAPYRALLEAEFRAAEGLLYEDMPTVEECCDGVRARAAELGSAL